MLGGIGDNMASLVQLGIYCAINVGDTTTMGYYVMKYLSKPYKLQEYQTIYRQLSKAGELVFKAEYLSLVKAKTMVLATSWNK